jgi:hypothetical protein
MGIEDTIKELAILRSTQELTAEIVESWQTELEQTPAFQNLQESKATLANLKSNIATVEERLRQEALEYARDTGQTKTQSFHVKTFKRLTYDPQTAINWCAASLPGALSLNKTQFEKVASSGLLDFVTIEEEQRTTIASDLSSYLVE